MSSPPGDLTHALLAIEEGEPEAYDRAMSLAYTELRKVARSQLRRSGRRATLDTTGLVHETYLKLVDQQLVSLQNRRHFFAIMARAMRQVIVDHARRRGAQKRGGPDQDLPLEESRLAGQHDRPEYVLAVHQALEALEESDPDLVRLVECRYFAGMTEEETAQTLDRSVRTIQRRWKLARAWLKTHMSGTGPRPTSSLPS
jgi:RNA polymerase sigma factor (TIGR02999 family)